MARQSPHPHIAAAEPDSAIGMARFFSPANLKRYRKLANGSIDVTERCRIFDMLAKELKAFRQEGSASTRHHPLVFENDVAARAQDVPSQAHDHTHH